MTIGIQLKRHCLVSHCLLINRNKEETLRWSCNAIVSKLQCKTTEIYLLTFSGEINSHLNRL